MLLGTVTKQPGETFKLGINFARRLQTLETLAGQVITSRRLDNGVDTTATLLTQPAAVDKLAMVRLRPTGVHGENHRVQMRVITSLGNTYEGELDVAVRET